MTAASVAELPLVSGHPALDLVNTVEPRLPVLGRHEHLAAPGDVLTWAQRVRLVNPAEAEEVTGAWAASPASAERALIAVRQVREALASVLSAFLARSEAPSLPEAAADLPEAAASLPEAAADLPEVAADVPGDLEYLATSWAGAASRSRLVLGGPGGMAARLAVGSSPALLIPDRVVHAAVELLCDTDLTSLRTCPVAEGGCGWVFLDRSRNRSRRWCTMAGCGSHAKARRLTERRRAARSSYRST